MVVGSWTRAALILDYHNEVLAVHTTPGSLSLSWRLFAPFCDTFPAVNVHVFVFIFKLMDFQQLRYAKLQLSFTAYKWINREKNHPSTYCVASICPWPLPFLSELINQQTYSQAFFPHLMMPLDEQCDKDGVTDQQRCRMFALCTCRCFQY
ncbi:hypothetical protein J3A83DRAFT_2556814 [Scleroderma citrinum]